MFGESQLTVLTVDDNEVLRYSVVRMLIEAGFKVVEARTGTEALKLAENLPDLITLDVNLPDMDGFKICEFLKANPRTKHIPILHVSGTFVDPEYRVRGLKNGADAYLAEPIDRAELIATVEALLRVRRAEKAAIQQAEIADNVRQLVQQENIELEVRVKERTAELEEKSAQIRRLSAHLMKVQDEERRKIARELHDSTGQYLAILNINLSKISKLNEMQSESANKLVTESMAITGELTSHLRTVSYLLHPPLLDEVGLASALRWYVQGFSERSKISVSLIVSDDFGRLPENLEIALFRIVQECLTNVHRHAGCQSARVELRHEDGKVHLSVHDTGTKFSNARPSVAPGTGILGMRERVRQLNGDIEFFFRNSGTTVSVVLPDA
jgi:signal transduction histidine kinase